MQEYSGEESIPELINLRDEEPPKRAQCPTTLELPEKTAVTAEKLPAFSFSPLKDHIRTFPAAAPKEIHPEEVPEEQIIYIDDDADPSPLQLLERQVDCLLMPPLSDTTPMAQKASKSLSRGNQLRMPERGRHSPGTTEKKTLQERQNGKSLKLNVYTVAKMCTGLVDTHHAQELAKLTTFLEVPKNKLEAEVPAPPQK